MQFTSELNLYGNRNEKWRRKAWKTKGGRPKKQDREVEFRAAWTHESKGVNDRVSKEQQSKQGWNKKPQVGKRPQWNEANRQHRKTIENMATAKAIEDLEDHEMTPESKLPREAARNKDKRPRGPVNIQRSNEQASQKPHKTRSNEISMKRHTNGKKALPRRKKQKQEQQWPRVKSLQAMTK